MFRWLNKVLLGATLLVTVSIAHADEGMWLFTNPPLKQLKEKYGFEPDAAWMEHLQKSCVRMGSGGSGSIVSANGLVMTNHHVGIDTVEKLSTPERDLVRDGFLARTYGEELKCPDLEVEILWSIEDMTAKVNEGVTDSMHPADANKARQKNIASLSAACEKDTGLNCEPVTLYHGARYHMYRYKRFEDVRLVMAPDSDAANFGGDTDNFEFPRYSLDMTFFRLYENGQPFKAEHHLKWTSTGIADNELIFIAGHPGRTQRLYTSDHLKFLRDVAYPSTMGLLWRREVQLQTFRARNAENARIADSDLQGVQNSRKAYTGMLGGLHDPALMQAKSDAEAKLRTAVAANPDWAAKWGDAWDRVASAQKTYATFYDRYMMLESRYVGGGSELYAFARIAVRLAEELPKANTDRLREYRDNNLDSVYLRLYSPAPIYDALEIDRLTSYFSALAERFGGDDPAVSRILAGKSPRERAIELVGGTKLKDVATRKALVEGGQAAVAASNDPLLRLVYDLDADARALRKKYEDEVESAERDGYAKIGAARFAVYGENEYPDATFTLRLTYGQVKGYDDGGPVPAFTNFDGLYARHKERGGVEPFNLQKRWLDKFGAINLKTPFNFVSNADVIGGNSGSPVVNKRGEVVGLVFDGNLPSLVWNAMFTDRQGRTLAVDARAIIESLKVVYEANELVKELTGQ